MSNLSHASQIFFCSRRINEILCRQMSINASFRNFTGGKVSENEELNEKKNAEEFKIVYLTFKKDGKFHSSLFKILHLKFDFFEVDKSQ